MPRNRLDETRRRLSNHEMALEQITPYDGMLFAELDPKNMAALRQVMADREMMPSEFCPHRYGEIDLSGLRHQIDNDRAWIRDAEAIKAASSFSTYEKALQTLIETEAELRSVTENERAPEMARNLGLVPALLVYI